jgi:protoporphyrinogen oxidase
VPDPALCCYGLENFCFAGDGLWTMEDGALVDLARREMATIGLARVEDVIDGVVVRQPKAYPVYDEGYGDRVAQIRRDLEAGFPTLHIVGRNGMHRYNNQDHAMMTALLAVANIRAGRRVYDLWRVNEDAEYIESEEEEVAASGASGLRDVPRPVTAAPRRSAVPPTAP